MFPVTTHQKLSPSRLFRVFECPGSFRFAQPYDQDTTQSQAAAEGEFMHTVVEKMIKKEPLPEVTTEQLQAADAALEYLHNIRHIGGHEEMFLEAQVDLKGYDSALYECGGTCDVHWVEENPGDSVLHVLDWKFGRSEPIWAHNNDQLLAYAWGCLARYPQIGFTKVILHIVMPRLDHYDSAEYKFPEMKAWLYGRAIPGALRAYSDNAPFIPGEKQCRWCAAKNYCRHRAMAARQTASNVFAAALRLPDDITIDEVSDLLKDIPQLKQYISDLEKFAMSQLLRGESVPGFKLVSGRSNRAWKDEAAAEVFLSNQFDIDEIYVSKLKSPSQIEALDRRMKKDPEFQELYHKAQGNPTMVPEYDKRPALDVRSAATVFENCIDENEDMI